MFDYTLISGSEIKTFTGFSGLKGSLIVGASGQLVPGALPSTMS